MSLTKKIITLLTVLSLFNMASWAQKVSSPLVGIWELSKYEFLNPEEEDSSDFEGIIIAFDKQNKYITYKKKGISKSVIGKGSYKISGGKKYLYEDGIKKGKIILLTKEEFVIDVDSNLILHFKRLKNKNVLNPLYLL